MSRVFIETVGCPKNQEDSERMAGILAASGHEIVGDPSAADAIVVNTCGFIEAAKRESIETIFDYVPYKEAGRRLIVTGCMAQRYSDELAVELTEADAILGVNDYEALPGILSDIMSGGETKQGGKGKNGDTRAPVTAVRSIPGISGIPRKALSPRYSSYLKVAEGCSNNCAYCAIPAIRGPYRSVPMEQLVREAEELAAEGCKELILIAQDVSMYGKDLYGKYALPELLRRICASEAAQGIEWIRLLYCYEERVTDELIEVMASEPKIVHYIDLPLQHVSDRILKSMRRISTGRSMRNTIERLRSVMPDIVIRTTFITGLPGETERDFEELYDFVSEMRFDRLGVFSYSPEDGTDAALMPDQVEPETAKARRDTLMQLQQGISLEKNERKIGSALDVIIDGQEIDGRNEAVWLGRTHADAPEIDCAVIVSTTGGQPNAERDIIGGIVRVQITDALDYDLVGELA